MFICTDILDANILIFKKELSPKRNLKKKNSLNIIDDKGWSGL